MEEIKNLLHYYISISPYRFPRLVQLLKYQIQWTQRENRACFIPCGDQGEFNSACNNATSPLIIIRFKLHPDSILEADQYLTKFR